ncbi:MAG: Uma2 family endonuclease [Polyangiaceae bacterium]
MAIISPLPGAPAPLTRAEYEELARRGVFDDARVELLNGRISALSPISKEHVYCVQKLGRLLQLAIDDRAKVYSEAPLAAPNDSLPQPDVFVTAAGDYLDDFPHTGTLVVEVADASLRYDRAKAKVYAQATVPEYWIVNLVDGVVEVHREPGASGYAKDEQGGAGIERVARFALQLERVAGADRALVVMRRSGDAHFKRPLEGVVFGPVLREL